MHVMNSTELDAHLARLYWFFGLPYRTMVTITPTRSQLTQAQAASQIPDQSATHLCVTGSSGHLTTDTVHPVHNVSHTRAPCY